MAKRIQKLSFLFAWPFLGLIYFYRYIIKPFLPRSCRFEPSCSAYAIDAIQTLGILKGGCKIIWRLLRCHPWCQGGYDPVLPHVLPNNEIKKDDRY